MTSSSGCTAWLLDGVRTPFGRFGGGLADVRTDDLAALPIVELARRHATVAAGEVDDIIFGDTNGAGEDNRNVARMAGLLAGLPVHVPGTTVNRLCGSGGEAIVQAARAVRAGDYSLVLAGGVESMTRAPFVVPRPTTAFPRELEVAATTVGWRLVNPRHPDRWVESLGRSAERMAEAAGIAREQQDEFALRSHLRASKAWSDGQHPRVFPAGELVADECVRSDASLERLAKLRPAFSEAGSVTAGNSSPVSDGAAGMLIGDDHAAARIGEPTARIVGSQVVGVEPDLFATAPVRAIRLLLERLGRPVESIDRIELNEAFAAMVLCCLAELPEVDPEIVNVNGGAIALGHPLGASMVRVVMDLVDELHRCGRSFGIAAACIGVGQGLAIAVELP